MGVNDKVGLPKMTEMLDIIGGLASISVLQSVRCDRVQDQPRGQAGPD
jgi:hypothetical protein